MAAPKQGADRRSIPRSSFSYIACVISTRSSQRTFRKPFVPNTAPLLEPWVLILDSGAAMRSVAILIILPLSAGLAFSVPPHSGNDPEKSTRKRFVKHTFGPEAVGMAGAGAGINQAANTPGEWGQGAAGFGRRFASGFGKHIVHNAIKYPVAKFLHEEFGYRPSNKEGFKPRLKYALLSTFITHKTTTGQPTPNVGEISGAVGSGLISRLWQPKSVASIGHGFTSAGITLGVDAGLNVVREFWPEIRHPHSHESAALPGTLR
jgi:hypothetical protein